MDRKVVGIMICCIDDLYSVCLEEDSWGFCWIFYGAGDDVGVTYVGLFVEGFPLPF